MAGNFNPSTSFESSLSLFGLIDSLDSVNLVSAFAGSVVFVLSAQDFNLIKRLIFGGVAVVTGYLSGDFVENLSKPFLPQGVELPEPLGVLAASAGSIRVLLMISSPNGLSFFNKFVGKDK